MRYFAFLFTLSLQNPFSLQHIPMGTCSVLNSHVLAGTAQSLKSKKGGQRASREQRRAQYLFIAASLSPSPCCTCRQACRFLQLAASLESAHLAEFILLLPQLSTSFLLQIFQELPPLCPVPQRLRPAPRTLPRARTHLLNPQT